MTSARSTASHDRLAQAEDIVELGSPRLKGFDSSGEPDVIPAIGAALHGVREGSLRANFLHHESDDEGKAVSLLHSVLLGVLLLAVIVWGVSFPIKDELRLGSWRAKTVSSRRRCRRCDARRNNLERLRKEAGFLSDLDQRRGEVLRVVDELSRIVPKERICPTCAIAPASWKCRAAPKMPRR